THDLISFPTRRSSDLFPGCLCRLSWPVVQKIAATSAATHLSRPRFRGRSRIYLRTRKSGDRRSESSEPIYRLGTHRGSGNPATRDRKSTRLNSSHGSI